jgi:hypothetical protein
MDSIKEVRKPALRKGQNESKGGGEKGTDLTPILALAS